MWPVLHILCVCGLRLQSKTSEAAQLTQQTSIFPQFWRLDQVPADAVSSKSSLLGLQTATFLLCPHTAERESTLCGVSSYKDDH